MKTFAQFQRCSIFAALVGNAKQKVQENGLQATLPLMNYSCANYQRGTALPLVGHSCIQRGWVLQKSRLAGRGGDSKGERQKE